MRSKLIGAVAVVVALFLLATNPVVANAAKQITGKQIKNNTVTTKDIKDGSLTSTDVKNGSLTASDLATGTIPAIPQVRRFNDNPFALLPNTNDLTFAGTPATVVLSKPKVVVVTGSIQIENDDADGDDVSTSACFLQSGSSALPSPLGGTSAISDDTDVRLDDNLFPVVGSDIMPAGTYQVGICASTFNNSQTVEVVDGTVTLYQQSGAFPRPGPTHRSHDQH